jgi:protein-disulfide isomerase
MYTDIFCPYCDKFSDAVTAHWDEFKSDYIDNRGIFFEIRITDMNYEAGHSNNSRPAGEGAYCAAKQEKFWDYYHGILNKLYEDYHSKGIGIDKTSPRIPDLEMSYFYDIADEAGLDHDKFVSCMENHETADELDKNTRRASAVVGGGVPYFTFGDFTTSGFAGKFDPEEYDWKQAKAMLDAGLSEQN